LIPGGVTAIFHWHDPSGRTMALGSTQPLTETSTSNMSWGVKAAGAQGRQPYHINVPIVWKYESLKLLESLRACTRITFDWKYIRYKLITLTL